MSGTRVLHVIATMQRRGGELFASDLIRWLNGVGFSQRALVLHQPNGMRIDYEVPTEVLGVDGWRAPGVHTSVPGLIALRRMIRSFDPDVVQAHGGEAFKYLVLSGVALGRPVVYRRIGAAPSWISRGPRRVAHGVLMNRAAKVVAVAEFVRRETVQLFGVPPAKVRTIPNAVNPARVKPSMARRAAREALKIPPTAPVILSVGAMTWEKDPLGQLAITARVLRELPEVIHLFVGDGPLRAEAEGTARALRIDESVRFLGSRDDVPDLMIASDVLLLASTVEGMPGGAIEAGMVGLPVAAYGVAGIPEVVVEGVTGRLAPPGDQTRLATCLVDLLRSPSQGRQMGLAARERCLELFGIEAVAPKYAELYRELTRA
jgi:glycosyltransferase involved in cell wall biosynthesis